MKKLLTVTLCISDVIKSSLHGAIRNATKHCSNNKAN